MAIVDNVCRVYSEEWARIAVREEVSGDFESAKYASRVAYMYQFMSGTRLVDEDDAKQKTKELDEHIAAYRNAKSCTA